MLRATALVAALSLGVIARGLPDVAPCVAEEIRAIELPAPTSAPVSVTYPVTFRTATN